MDLHPLGWNEFHARNFEAFARDFLPARVSAQHRQLYRLLSSDGELVAAISGRLRQLVAGPQDFPAVGDWVAVRARLTERRATIHQILPRRTKFTRQAAGRGIAEQVLAANVDSVFVMAGLDGDFNLRRLERYLIAAWESGAQPVIVLNKADLCDDVAGRILLAEAVAPGTPVHAISSVDGYGLGHLVAYLTPGQTIALLGSSGVGKSTLINRLLGSERQPTRAVLSGDSRGRHTTTSRELIPLPGGALVIDTPGLRELQLWSAEDGMDAAFADIAELAAHCRFHDCRHHDEPGCAVRDRMNPARLANYHKTQRELDFLARRQDVHARLAEKQRWKAIHRALRDLDKRR
jgi:ribosome biogenesis GTPase